MDNLAGTYEHEPLNNKDNQIRLLRFDSGSPDHNINCHLYTFDIAHAPPYVAFSYTWGSVSPTARVNIDGKTLKIRQNLCNFLQAYRNSAGNVHYIWVDQICIAQADVEERNSQVRLMSSIFQRCLCTIVWLGSEVRNLASMLVGTAPLPMPPSLKRRLATEIFRHVYFGRLWVIQEVLLPPFVRILCGNVWMTFDELLEAYGHGPPPVYLPSSGKTARWDMEPAEGHSLLEYHDDIISAYRHPQRFISLYQCVTSFACHQCSDDRDRIYGLLGLVPEDQRLVIDYSKTPEQVFLDVVMALMARGEWDFAAHYFSHSYQAGRLAAYMGLRDHEPAIRALLSDLSDLGRIDMQQVTRIESCSTRFPSNIILKFTPGHNNSPDTWCCQHRDKIYLRTNENSEERVQQMRCAPDTPVQM